MSSDRQVREGWSVPNWPARAFEGMGGAAGQMGAGNWEAVEGPQGQAFPDVWEQQEGPMDYTGDRITWGRTDRCIGLMYEINETCCLMC